ncbi:DUF1176 domain-containing protein [Rhizobium sp.]
MKFRQIILAAALATSWLPAAAVHAGISKKVRDWTVECSNGLTCTMSFADWASKNVQYVGFQRAGGPDAPIVLRLGTYPDFSPAESSAVTFRILVDGQELLSLTGADLMPDEHDVFFSYSDQPKVSKVLAAMAAGKTAEVYVSGGLGTRFLPIKLDGVTGAMLYVDEVQGRLGRTDALQEKGDKKPDRRFVAKDVRSLDDMHPMIRKDFTESGGACSDLEPDTIRQFQGFDVTVGLTEFVAVPCATGGAYNQPYALYTVGEVVERISFPIMADGKPTAMATAMNLDFDPVSRTLTSFFRGRGIGDCGQYYKWQINDTAGRLTLVEMRSKEDCDEGSNDPATFPRVWPMSR